MKSIVKKLIIFTTCAILFTGHVTCTFNSYASASVATNNGNLNDDQTFTDEEKKNIINAVSTKYSTPQPKTTEDYKLLSLILVNEKDRGNIQNEDNQKALNNSIKRAMQSLKNNINRKTDKTDADLTNIKIIEKSISLLDMGVAYQVLPVNLKNIQNVINNKEELLITEPNNIFIKTVKQEIEEKKAQDTQIKSQLKENINISEDDNKNKKDNIEKIENSINPEIEEIIENNSTLNPGLYFDKTPKEKIENMYTPEEENKITLASKWQNWEDLSKEEVNKKIAQIKGSSSIDPKLIFEILDKNIQFFKDKTFSSISFTTNGQNKQKAININNIAKKLNILYLQAAITTEHFDNIMNKIYDYNLEMQNSKKIPNFMLDDEITAGMDKNIIKILNSSNMTETQLMNIINRKERHDIKEHIEKAKKDIEISTKNVAKQKHEDEGDILKQEVDDIMKRKKSGVFEEKELPIEKELLQPKSSGTSVNEIEAIAEEHHLGNTQWINDMLEKAINQKHENKAFLELVNPTSNHFESERNEESLKEIPNIPEVNSAIKSHDEQTHSDINDGNI